MIAAFFFAASVFVLTLTLWPVPRPKVQVFIDDDSIPRTLH